MKLLFLLLLLPSMAQAAPPETLIPMGTYAPGTYTVTSASLSNETQFTFQIDRKSWTDPKVILELLAETSNDNGKTFIPRCGATSYGGVIANTPFTSISCSLPSGIGIKRVRFTATITGGSLTASGVLLTK
jgi:hypothetical protein